MGRVAFETETLQTKGGNQETHFYYLNELQTNFVVTLSRNTPEVVAFKKGLVIAFDKAKKEIQLLETVIQESEDYLEKKRLYYEKQGYSENWIKERLKSIEIRDGLEALWCKNGIDKPQQFAVLTSVISKGLFGITPTEHKKLKGLKNHNLRDNMTLRELIFMSLAEISTSDFAEASKAQNYEEHKKVAKKGRELAGVQKELYESQTGKKVLSSLNFLAENRVKNIQS